MVDQSVVGVFDSEADANRVLDQLRALPQSPEGLRVEGYEANVAFWEAMVADPNGTFEVEDVVISGDRATNRCALDRCCWSRESGGDRSRSVPVPAG